MIPNERAADDDDVRFMRRALELAEGGWGQTAPNPMVGAVVARDGEIVGEGYHAVYGGPHAEVVALGAAGERARGATLYVTLEPCAHTGKTPPCTDAVIAAGLRRVVAAVEDPNPTARGGAKKLRKAGIDVTLGVLEQEAREQNVIYFHGAEFYRPFVTLKLALSREGAIADANRNFRWLTGPEARREVHRLRAGHDAVAVGLGTVIADDPELTVREAPAPRKPPVRVIFSRAGKLPTSSRLVASAREVPVILFVMRIERAHREVLTAAGVQVIEVRDLNDGLLELASLGARSVLLEGGARIAGAALRAGSVDRIVMFQTRVELGPDGLFPF
ncbi:MAG TPA: bifunctional diaminohydroxyphosphoribosylaminopyrimidine deaminase/5-amino-6-(5-phosphoribosylamino)uracil reductase RibD, partial [Gemmatimonadaceae bacterium]|nr:bifunctional diaminohydroxyphosphoribosylaminopyrimidine deaminase/5-amino-6-(5-phosphoribosylamino)uracil reductase RibD [Gemmatimonadaceae bacterium]